jgi:hypothetical protein
VQRLVVGRGRLICLHENTHEERSSTRSN